MIAHQADSKPITVDWDEISSYVESLHLNWDPSTFAHSHAVHCTLNAKADSSSDRIRTTTLSLKLDSSARAVQEVWVLLSRHEVATAGGREFVGVGVAARWAKEAGEGPARVDEAVSASRAHYCLFISLTKFKPE